MKCIHEAAMVKDKIRQTRQKDEKENIVWNKEHWYDVLGLALGNFKFNVGSQHISLVGEQRSLISDTNIFNWTYLSEVDYAVAWTSISSAWENCG